MKKKAGILAMSLMLGLSVCNVSAMEDTADAAVQEVVGIPQAESAETSDGIQEIVDETEVPDDSEEAVQYLEPSVSSKEEEQPISTGFTGWWQAEDGYWYYYENDVICKGWLDLNGSVFYLDETTGRMATGWSLQPEGWHYFDAEGRQVKGWLYDGGWYYLMPDTGIMTTKPQMINGKNYRFYSSGLMYENSWYRENDNWYYYGSGGAMATGWALVGNTWYYLMPDTGIMTTEPQTINGKSYRFSASGAMYANTWYKEDDNWYYYGASGAMATGWALVGNTWYYLMPDTGIMTTEPQTINGKSYRFSASGAMYANAWYKEDGNWYYYGASGAMATGWVKVNGYWYYLDQDGVMQTGWEKVNGVWYYLDASGSMASESWRKVNGEWYYFTASGSMVTGWYKVNGLWYYMYDDGRMAHDTTIDGYELSSSGAWLTAGAAAAKAAAQGVIDLAGADLYACFEWIVNNCTYKSVYGTPPEGYTWEEWRAAEMFNNRKGDCHNYAALFGYVARELGYDAQIISGYTTTVSGDWVDHGWVEIDGVRYDPDLEYELGINGFGATGIQYKYTLD